MAKQFKYTIGVDPSGAFIEGKGTTGWCVINTNNEVLEVGTVSAKQYNTATEYWNAHLILLSQLFKKYSKRTALSIEDYILYKNYAMAQVNSTLETVQLLGIIKYFCYINKHPYFLRPAVAVKKRWEDNILVYKGILTRINKHYIVPAIPTKALCDHERDAIRHAVHFNVFENKEVSYGKNKTHTSHCTCTRDTVITQHSCKSTRHKTKTR